MSRIFFLLGKKLAQSSKRKAQREKR